MRMRGAEIDLPLLGRDLAGDDAKERRLAGAVAADKPDMGAGRQRDRGMVEQGAAADTIGEVGEGKHGTSSAAPCLAQPVVASGCAADMERRFEGARLSLGSH